MKTDVGVDEKSFEDASQKAAAKPTNVIIGRGEEEEGEDEGDFGIWQFSGFFVCGFSDDRLVCLVGCLLRSGDGVKRKEKCRGNKRINKFAWQTKVAILNTMSEMAIFTRLAATRKTNLCRCWTSIDFHHVSDDAR